MLDTCPTSAYVQHMTTQCPDHPDSPADLSDHIGRKPCASAPALKRDDGQPLRWYDLPMAGGAWQDAAAGR